jgi:hypothetical protein
MPSLIVNPIVLQCLAFLIATVALFLNIDAGVGLSSAQHIQLSVDINLLSQIPSSFPIYPDNVTVDTAGLRTLAQCTEYVETHVPIVEYFNTTITVNLTYAEMQLANLTTLMEGRGTVTIGQVGTVRIEETNVTVPYSQEYITFGNSQLHYVAVEPTLTMAVLSSTTALTFSGWAPPIGIAGSTGYNAIYDANQLDVQSALPAIRVEKKQYLDSGAIVLGESTVMIGVGDVVSVRERLEL